MKKVIVVLLIIFGMLVVCAAIGVVAYITLAPSAQFGSLFNRVSPANFSVEATEESDYNTSGPAQMDVQTPFGSITVNGSPDSKVHVSAHKTAWGINQAAAEKALQDIKVVITQDQDRFTIRVEQPKVLNLSNGTNAGSVSFMIQVPSQTTVVAQSSSGNITLSGTQGKADLVSNFGEVEVTNFLGGLAARSQSGRVTARQVGLLPSGNGDVSLQSNFGEVSLEDIQVEHVSAHSASGSIDAVNTVSSNEVDLSSDFGSITFNTGQATSMKINTKSGGITLTDLVVSGPLTAHSDFGSLNLTHVTAGSYDLSSDNGAITSDIAQGNFKAISKFGSIDVSGGSQPTLDLETTNGKVTYRGSLGSGRHTFKSDFGDIRISLPQDSTFKFDLRTEFGKITSDFKVSIDGQPNEDYWTGMVGNGEEMISAVTKNGAIHLEAYQP